jgi:hypothetical protein
MSPATAAANSRASLGIEELGDRGVAGRRLGKVTDADFALARRERVAVGAHRAQGVAWCRCSWEKTPLYGEGPGSARTRRRIGPVVDQFAAVQQETALILAAGQSDYFVADHFNPPHERAVQRVGGSKNGDDIRTLKRDVSTVIRRSGDGHVDVGTPLILCMVRIRQE